jgi:hypothetical protein
MPPAVTRRLVTLAAVASLLLCAATVVLWVRSYWKWEHIKASGGDDEIVLRSAEGILSLTHYHEPSLFTRARRLDWQDEYKTRYDLGYRVRALWCFAAEHAQDGTDWKWRLSSPHWFLALSFAILPALLLLPATRSRRSRGASLCPACGYDLRATPARCPECGAVPAATAAR